MVVEYVHVGVLFCELFGEGFFERVQVGEEGLQEGGGGGRMQVQRGFGVFNEFGRGGGGGTGAARGFGGEANEKVDVEGLQYVITFGAVRPGEGGKVEVNVRAHMIRTVRSGEKLPRVEVEEMGPRMDLSVRRVREAEPELLREALRRPKAGVVGCSALERKGLVLICETDKDEEERRDGYYGRQVGEDSYGETGFGEVADSQDEGAQGGEEGARRGERWWGDACRWRGRGEAEVLFGQHAI